MLSTVKLPLCCLIQGIRMLRSTVRNVAKEMISNAPGIRRRIEVIPLQFEHAFNFEDNGLALVSFNGKSYYINKKGEKVEK